MPAPTTTTSTRCWAGSPAGWRPRPLRRGRLRSVRRRPPRSRRPRSVRLVISVIVWLPHPTAVDARSLPPQRASPAWATGGLPHVGQRRFGETVPGQLLLTVGVSRDEARRPPYLGDGGRLGSRGLRPPTSNRSPCRRPAGAPREAQLAQRARVLGARLDLVPGARGGDRRGVPPRSEYGRSWSSRRCSATSRGTPCRRRALVICETTSSGWSFSSSSAICLAASRTWSGCARASAGVEVQALAPLVTGAA